MTRIEQVKPSISKLSMDRFTNELNKVGLAHSNLFVVEFGTIKGHMHFEPHGAHNPAVVGSWHEKDVMRKELVDKSKLALFVQSVNIPQSKIDKYEYEGDRVPIDVPSKFENGELDIEFLCDATMVHKHYFDEWMYNVINPVEHYHGFYNDYICNIVIKMFDLHDGLLRNVVEMTECYPIAMSNIDLKYGPDNQHVTFKVTFTYRHKYETQVTDESLNILGEVSNIQDSISDFESLLNQSGFTGLAGLAAGIGGIAKTIGGYANQANSIIGGVTRQIDTVRGVQSTVSGTINKIRTPISNATSGAKDARSLIPGAKNLLNVLKR